MLENRFPLCLGGPGRQSQFGLFACLAGAQRDCGVRTAGNLPSEELIFFQDQAAVIRARRVKIGAGTLRAAG